MNESMYRTHRCGALTADQTGEEVTLAGWVNTRRDHGGLIFIDLRDSTGLIQIRFDPKTDQAAWKVAEQLRPEFVVQVRGEVVRRPPEMINQKIPTGQLEVNGRGALIINTAKTPPFPIDRETMVGEEVRLSYRYLDLRRPWIQQKLEFRSRFVSYIRHFLLHEGFWEIETPILGKSTPEGARDYLVPSRQHPGKFYALPQSPQQYKQLLMVAGIDKYFQIAPCFRDEDARADRAPDQFYQLDLEMAFVEQKDILSLIERLFTSFVEKETSAKILQKPWPRIPYAECLSRFGTDRPDLRYGLELQDVTSLAKQSSFSVFTAAPTVLGLVAPNAEKLSRKTLETFTTFVQEQGAKGLAWMKVSSQGLESPIAKFFPTELQQQLITTLKASNGDMLLFIADETRVAQSALGALRVRLAHELQLTNPNRLAFAFIVDFPLFEADQVDGHYAPSHHMFTRPKEEDLPLLASDPHRVRSWQHDFILNGFEVGGGSLRIHDRKLQEKIFELIGLELTKARKDFGHMLEAFEYGAPPHGGIAPGIDRLLMVLLNEPNVREVVAFPKTGDNRDLTVGSPSDVDAKQLRDLHLRLARS